MADIKIISVYSGEEVQRMLENDELFMDRMTELKSLRIALLKQKDYNCALKEQLRRATEIQLKLETTLIEMEEQLQQHFEKVSAVRKQIFSKNVKIGALAANHTTASHEHERQRQQCDERSDGEMQEILSDGDQPHEISIHLTFPPELLESSPPKKKVRLNRERKNSASVSNTSDSEPLTNAVQQCYERNHSVERDNEVAHENNVMEEILPQPRVPTPVNNAAHLEAALQLKKCQDHLTRISRQAPPKTAPGGRKQAKTFSCSECGKEFSQKYRLIRHFRIHTGEKPFECQICNKRFNEKTDLHRHLLIHTNERPFTCDICQKSFRRKYHLSQHMKIHSKRLRK